MRTSFLAHLALAGLLALTGRAQETEAPTTQEEGEWKPFESSLPPLPEIPPPDREELDAAIKRGVDFLVSNQNDNGSWGAATMTKGLNIMAPIPGAHHAFRAGTSGLALEGILATGDQRPEVQAMIDKAEAWFLKELPRLRRAERSTIYNNWGHAYALSALSSLYEYREGDEAKRSALKNLAQQQVEMLRRYEDVNGGWGYYDFDSLTRKPSGIPTSFTTATVMISMKKARDAMGVQLPERETKRGVAFILRQQTPDFAYVYSDGHRYRPRYSINRPGGSLCRSQACNAALRLWGDQSPTDEVLKTWLDRFILRNGWIDIARKRPVPHETHFANSGYFYYYGHYYAKDCIALLPESDRSVYYRHLVKILLPKQEKNGSWWDYPLYSYGPPYGTGYVLSTLSACREGVE